MRSLFKIVGFAVLVAFLVATFALLNASSSIAQMRTNSPISDTAKYFLDTPPSKDDLANLPSRARDVIVAKVGISKSAWLGMRDQSGMPAPLPKNIFWAQVRLISLLSGAAKAGDQLDVYIATIPTILRYIVPVTPEMKAREYFVVIFVNSENERELLGVPASREEFERWKTGLREKFR